MRLSMRPYRDESDFWRIRGFLREVLIANNLLEYSWHLARLDYWRWHVTNCGGPPPGSETVFIWETPAGGIAAVLNPEGNGEAFIQIHPEYRSEELEEEIISTAEEKYLMGNAEKLRFMVFAEDSLRKKILFSRGYRRESWNEQYRTMKLEAEIEVPKTPDGYHIRHQRPEDVPSRIWASWRAFHPNAPDDQFKADNWYGNIEKIPTYRRDLDLVAVSENGEVVAFCTIWYDDVTRTGYMEPVGRKPEIRVKHLMRSLLLEGAARLQRSGGVQLSVGGTSFSANVLYASVMGIAHKLVIPWVKQTGKRG